MITRERGARWRLGLLCLGLIWASACATGGNGPARAEPAAEARAERPKLRLAVLLVVDQLRQGLFEGVLERLQPVGMRRFLEQGVVYRETRYAHAITETAVGHATLVTGALPREHGIVGNEWLDLASHQRVYAVDDAGTQLVGSAGSGKSPSKLLVPTLGDALIESSHGRARVRAVSEKDRGAVLPAGKRGTAFWLHDGSGQMVSSTYYLSALPAWLGEPALTARRFAGKSWTLHGNETSYHAPDDHPWERGPEALGYRFPHALPGADTEDFARTLKHTPFADELIADVAVRLVTEDQLGMDDAPDFLSVSLSSTDYIGHSYGPESREAEDNLLALDRTLASLMERIEQRVGSEHVLFVLSADHGIQESPEWFTAQGKDAGRIEPTVLLPTLNAALKLRFHATGDLIADFVNPYLWIDEPRVAAEGLSLSAVEDAALALVRAQPGVHAVFLRRDLLAGRYPHDELSERVARSVHPTRSGHLYVVPKERWLLATSTNGLCAMHGTPWEGDVHVPMMWLVPNVAPRALDRPVDPRAVAPTLATLLGVPPPAGSSGSVLAELGP